MPSGIRRKTLFCPNERAPDGPIERADAHYSKTTPSVILAANATRLYHSAASTPRHRDVDKKNGARYTGCCGGLGGTQVPSASPWNGLKTACNLLMRIRQYENC